MTEPVIEVRALHKRYGPTVAVDDVGFTVARGEIFGLLGPNGAGKTTSMECIAGIRTADRGEISVLGLDPRHQYGPLRQRIGVQLQEAQLQKRIKVHEAITLWSSLYPETVDGDHLLDQLGLTPKRDTWFMRLSGGQKQRLSIALALIHDPELVFLDELTTGLDPQARRTIWTLVRDIRERGKTVLLTTHLMEEAERLCDRVAIVEHGRVIAMGTPAELVREHCPGSTVVLTPKTPVELEVFEQLPGLERVEMDGEVISLRGSRDDFVAEVIDLLAEKRVRVRDLQTVRSNLEDVFLELTGHSIRD